MATVVSPLYSGMGTSGTINPRSEVWWANETDFGDKPQTKHSADKILGSFVFKVENINVVMTQSSSDPKRFEYKYTADLLIRDGLGLNKGDPGIPQKLLKIDGFQHYHFTTLRSFCQEQGGRL